MYDKVLKSNDFITREDGASVATILATTHGLAETVFVERFSPAMYWQYKKFISERWW